MRRFIYLDTETLNSYLAQIYDGLIEECSVEKENSKIKAKKNTVSLGIGAKIALKLFGKGIDADANTQLEHVKELANQDIVKDVQTKIMHDNAFEQFLQYLNDNNLVNESSDSIGNFVKLKNEFYIFDIEFYKQLFEENGFVHLLKNIQEKAVKDNIEEQYANLPRESRRDKNTKSKKEDMQREAIDKNEENYDAAKILIDMLAAIIPYPQVLCIENCLVVLNEKYMRDDITTAAFKYGGRINVVGYVTNKVNAQADTPVSKLSGVSTSFNEITKMFFDNVDEMYIVHPIAIYYDNSVLDEGK